MRIEATGLAELRARKQLEMLTYVVSGTTAADVQRQIDLAHDAGGGVVYLPPGNYTFTKGVVIDNSADTGRFANRVSIKGGGSAFTSISATGFAGPAISYIGDNPHVESHLRLEGFRITGDLFAGSIGIDINISAFAALYDVVVESFDTNFRANDIEQCLFERSSFRWGNHGVEFKGSLATTDPNSLTFLDCTIGNNYQDGILITNANAVVFLNGSIQYNGTTGVAGEYGAKFADPGTGYGTINFYGTIFEGNGGDADLIVNATSLASQTNLYGVSFARANSTNYATNNIVMSGAATTQYLLLSGCNFRHFNDYTPNAGRPYLNISNTNCKVVDDGANYFQSTTEDPSWSGYARQPQSLAVGSGVVTPYGVVHARTGTNQNFFVNGPFSEVSGMSIGAINDALAGLLPLEVRASGVRLPSTIGFNVTPVAKQTVTGSRGGNAALADLLTKLANLGLITDSTS